MQTEKEYLVLREIDAMRCESVGEYSLPDYNGDVKRVLAVNPRLSPDGKFVGDDTLEVSGGVTYDVVYIDKDDEVTHAEFSTDYSAAVRINSQTYVDSLVKTRVAGCNLRIVGPRKLSVKCSLESDVMITEEREHSVSGDAFLEYEPETLTSIAKIHTASFVSGESREISEEMAQLDGAISDEVEILLSDATFSLEGVTSDEDAIEIKGAIKASVLYRNGDEAPRLVTREIAYAESLEANTYGAEALDPYVQIGRVMGSVSATDDGVSISLSLTATSYASVARNASFEVVNDAYFKERGCANEYADFSYNEHVCTESRESRFEGQISLSDAGIEGGIEVIWSDAVARVDECALLDGSVKISGEIRFSGIGCKSDDEINPICYPVKFTLPFEENVNINCQTHGNMRVNCHATAFDAEIKITENDAMCSCDLILGVSLSSEKRQRCLGASNLTDEEYATDASVVTVYYPDASESLFEIAKRFHTSVSAIAVSNRLSESALASLERPLGAVGVNKLIIK